MITLNCQYCSKEYKTQHCWIKRNKYHCCSRECNGNLKNKIKGFCVCIICKREFLADKSKRKKLTCSDSCLNKLKQKKINKICKICSKNYTVNKYRENTSLYCSKKCLYRSKSINNQLFNCKFCNKKYERKPSWIKVGTNFCSKKCKDFYFCGKNHPNYVKREILRCTNCNKKFSRKNYEVNKVRNFCSHKCFSQYNRNENHYEWKELDHIALYKDKLRKWSISVKTRDNYTCQKCEENNKKILHAHHILEKNLYPEFSLDIENGITLCKYCHADLHKDNKIVYNLIINKP